MSSLKALMTTLSQQGLQEQRSEIIYNFTGGRTQSARELTPTEITALCHSLKGHKKDLQLDKKRKRLLAAIFGVFKLYHKKPTMAYVKAIACRAAKVERFNDIPPARLVSLYNAFLHAQRDISHARRLVAHIEMESIEWN